jgi:hypothetical protein
LLLSGRVTGAPDWTAERTACAWIWRRSRVISSASISCRPSPKRCGASRLAGRVNTLPPNPAEPNGRAWQAAQLSLRPAPWEASASMSPTPSSVRGPRPCCMVNLRWKSCRPREMARNGSRRMRYTDEPGVHSSPRPAPTSSSNDFLMPALAALGVCVMSVSCADAPPARRRSSAPRRAERWAVIGISPLVVAGAPAHSRRPRRTDSPPRSRQVPARECPPACDAGAHIPRDAGPEPLYAFRCGG